jgi:hypothetical protein
MKRRAPPLEPDEDARKRAAVISRLQELDAAGTRRYLDDVAGRWQLDAHTLSFQDAIARAFQNFGLDVMADVVTSDVGSYGLQQIDDRIHEHEMEIIALYHKLREHSLLEDPGVLARTMKCLEQVYYAKRMVLSTFQAQLSLHQVHCPDMQLDENLDARLGSWSVRFRWISDDTNNVQKLLLHMLDCAMEKRYRRQGSSVFEPVVVDGHVTHAWKAVMQIKDWVYAETRKELHFEQWQWLTSANNNTKAVIEYLTSCNDYSLPELRKDRSTFAFNNGVYRASEDRFYTHDGPDRLGPDVVACKFFPLDFDPHAGRNVDDIPTPHLDMILEYQGFSTEVRRWMLILLGRLLYDLNSKDSWQIIPFFKGLASSGKSTLVLKIAKQFYEAIDVGVLSNNGEKQFGLSAFHDKLLFVAPEIKSDLKIEQAEFQSIVSGEDISISIKHKTAFSKQWNTPGVLAGNEVPSWCDNSGSIQRRIVLFDFARQVTHGDMRLGDKLELELPMILLKCNRAYLEAVRQWSHTNVWTVLPAYFLHTRDEMAQATNVVEAFLASPDVVLKEDAFVPLDDFKMALRVFSQQNNYKHAQRFTWEYFRGPMEKFGIKKSRGAREYRGRKLTRDYLDGVDLMTAEIATALG